MMQTVSDGDNSCHRVFISYSSSDRQRVDGLERLFVLFGHEVFLDFKKIRLGTRWKDELKSALQRTDVTLLYWTRSASLSTWVRNEYEYFLAHHPDRPLVPILGDNTPLSEPLKERQALTFVPVINELFEMKRTMQAEGRNKTEIQAAIRKKLEDEGIAAAESDFRRIFKFVGVAGWFAWAAMPLLFFEWIWRSLFDAAIQLSGAQAALLVLGAATSATSTWQVASHQMEKEERRRVVVANELQKEKEKSKAVSSHARVLVSGIIQPTLLQLSRRSSQDRYTVLFPGQQDLQILVPEGAYQTHYALPKIDPPKPLVDREGKLLQPRVLPEQRFEPGKEYTLKIPVDWDESQRNVVRGYPAPNHAVTPGSIIETVAGRSKGGDGDYGNYGGDNAVATEALLSNPSALAIGQDGSIYIADTENHRVRRVTPGGTIVTVAGTGTAGFSGDGGLAVQAKLHYPRGLGLDADGNLYIYDFVNHRVRRVDEYGIIATVAGGGSGGSGDGGPATEARLDYLGESARGGGQYRDNTISFSRGFQVAPDGSFFVVDDNRRVRRIDSAGTISTYAGGGDIKVDDIKPGDAVDSVQASLDSIEALALGPKGELFLATKNSIYRIESNGFMSPVSLESEPTRPFRSLAIGPNGSLYFCQAAVMSSDNDGHGIQQMLPDGRIIPIVGNGKRGNSGDGGPVGGAQIQGPNYLAVANDGTLYFSDSGNHRVRKISPGERSP